MYRIHDTQSRSVDGQDLTVLELEGHFDNATAPRLKDMLAKIYAEARYRVVVDGAKLAFISSAGIGSILSVVHQFRAKGGDVKLAGLSEKVMGVFQLLGLEDVLEVHPNVQTAARKFATPKK